jgi:hypothetical protein
MRKMTSKFYERLQDAYASINQVDHDIHNHSNLEDTGEITLELVKAETALESAIELLKEREQEEDETK